MNKGYRHGEILLLNIKSLPKELKKINTKIFGIGKNKNNHTINTGNLFEDKKKNLYLEAKDTSLLHKEHSPKIGDAKIEDGFYKLIKQTEFTPEGLKPVAD